MQGGVVETVEGFAEDEVAGDVEGGVVDPLFDVDFFSFFDALLSDPRDEFVDVLREHGFLFAD